MFIKEVKGKFYVKDILHIFRKEPYVFCLESSLFEKKRGRYSIIGFDPFDVYRQKGDSHLDKLKEKFQQYKRSSHQGPLPFYSGIVGFMGYDYGLYQENISFLSEDDLALPDCLFGFYDRAIIIDHLEEKLFISSSGLPEKNAILQKKRAQRRLDDLLKRLDSYLPLSYRSNLMADSERTRGTLTSNFTKREYKHAVQKALNYIYSGDIYQVNLSQRFCFTNSGKIDPVYLYQLLAVHSPSSFGVFFDAGSFRIISSSPERFLRLDNGMVHTRPMKGTRPRGINIKDDRHYKKQIKESAKERAELLMITDLERNDLGRVCEYGSVKVKEMRSIESYSTVYQATSMIEGKLRKDRDEFDLIKATFPGGSITGCPKIRSMQIIEELEPTRRGIYTGSCGYIDFSGNMDLNILIRTFVVRESDVYFQVGGGIVADSTPDGEYEETLVKAKAMKAALLHSQDTSSDPIQPSARMEF